MIWRITIPKREENQILGLYQRTQVNCPVPHFRNFFKSVSTGLSEMQLGTNRIIYPAFLTTAVKIKSSENPFLHFDSIFRESNKDFLIAVDPPHAQLLSG